jgi:predicted RNA-binding Zn ribbon-like protein
MTDVDLPELLELPLASGEPWWYWLGGRPALDFVNTLRERWRRQVETLVTAQDLGRWLVSAGVLERQPRRVPADLVESARELREAIDLCVRAAVEGAPLPGPAARRIDGWLVHAASRPQLAWEAGVATIGATPLNVGSRPGEGLILAALGAVALDAAQMLGTPRELERIRVCASETCSARFYDRSPAGARRWCSMTMCGNEAKARRHRARRRKATA